VPLIPLLLLLLLLLLVVVGGTAAYLMHGLGIALVVARLAHA